METLERVIAEHPFLAGMNAEHTRLLVGCASNVRYSSGTYVFREGEDANHFYLIRHGRVALEIFAPQRKPIVVGTLDEGDVLGWSWLVPPHQWRFNARAAETTVAIALDGKCLRAKCDETPALGYDLLKRFATVMVHRLEMTRLQLLDLYSART
jgi:CRP-like cAMP-binding protein